MIKRLMNPGPTDLWTSIGLLVLRLAAGGMMLYGHGWKKLMSFSEKAGTFADPLGIGNELSMAAAVGAEAGCALLIALGLFTRAAAVPLMFTMIIAAFVVHGGDPFQKRELALFYLAAYTTLACTGAGRFSVDGAVR